MRAIILNLSAWAVLPFMDTIAKYLSAELSFFQITWARYFFTVFWTLPFMFIFFRKNLTFSQNPKLQILRGLTLFFANICFFYSISIISISLLLLIVDIEKILLIFPPLPIACKFPSIFFLLSIIQFFICFQSKFFT